MDDAVDRDKDNRPIGPRRGQRNRTSIAHFDPTPRTTASYKDCIGAEVEPVKKKKRTIIQVDTDHDDSDVEKSMSDDSDLFPESSDEESSSLNKAGGRGNEVRSIILTTVIYCTLHILLQIYRPFFLAIR